MLQAYVLNVSSVSDVCCKYSMSMRGKSAQTEVVPACVREAKRVPRSPRACAAAGACVPQQYMELGQQALQQQQRATRCSSNSGRVGRQELHAYAWAAAGAGVRTRRPSRRPNASNAL
jgi:hypothetical protein